MKGIFQRILNFLELSFCKTRIHSLFKNSCDLNKFSRDVEEFFFKFSIGILKFFFVFEIVMIKAILIIVHNAFLTLKIHLHK